MRTQLIGKPDVVQRAWIAGLYEGEGSCSIVRRYTNRPGVRLNISMTDLDAVERVREYTGMGSIHTHQRPQANVKPLHTWEVSVRGQVRLMIEWLLPFMCQRRRERLREAVRILDAPLPCKSGRHLLRAENTGIWATGKHAGCLKCLDCENERADRRRQRARQPEAV